MHPWLKMLLGGGIALSALPVALLLAAVLALGECPETCVPESERVWGWLGVIVALLVGLVGVWLVAAGWRETRRGG